MRVCGQGGLRSIRGCSGGYKDRERLHPIISLSIRQSVCLSIYLSVCQSVCLSIYLSVSQCVCLSIYLSIYLSQCQCVCQSACESIKEQLDICVRARVYTSVHLFSAYKRAPFKYSSASTSSLLAAMTITPLRGRLLRMCLLSLATRTNVT